MSQRERSIEMADGLAVREDGLCSLGRGPVCVGRLEGTPRFTLVDGDQDVPRHVVAGRCGRFVPVRLGGASVEEPATGQARRVVGGIAHVAVAEVEADRAPQGIRVLPDEPPSDEVFERDDGLLLRPAARVSDRRQIEHPADDRRRRQDLARGFINGRDALSQQGSHTAGDGHAGVVTAGEHLGDVQRQPLRVGGDRVDVGIGRLVGRAGGPNHLGDPTPIEAFERQAEGPGHPDQVVCGCGALDRQVLASPGDDQDEGPAREPASEIGHGLAGRVVDEMQVVDPDRTARRSGDEHREGAT